jgi:hypothetical protein
MALKTEKESPPSDEQTESRHRTFPNRKKPGKVRVVPRLNRPRVEEHRSASDEAGKQSSK